MNSFTLTAVGYLARSPEVVTKGDVTCTRFCLIGNDYGGKDDEGVAREVITSVWFSAFGAAGETIARHSQKGDQLIVEARVRSNVWTDKQGEKQYDHSFVVQGFKFGAPGKTKREEFDARREQTLSLPRADGRGNDLEPQIHDEHSGLRDEGMYAGSASGAVVGVADSSRGTTQDAQGSAATSNISDANGSEVPHGSHRENDAARTKAVPALSKTTPEKSRGARSSRKTAPVVA